MFRSTSLCGKHTWNIRIPESRKKEDKAAKQLSAVLDISASIQLVKCAQRASVVGQQMVSSTGQATLMHACIEHYSKIFNS